MIQKTIELELLPNHRFQHCGSPVHQKIKKEKKRSSVKSAYSIIANFSIILSGQKCQD